ncbi:hypothetical protein Tco_1565060 [Tanacetum coccineum]
MRCPENFLGRYSCRLKDQEDEVFGRILSENKPRVSTAQVTTASTNQLVLLENEIDQNEGISWFQEDSETQGRYGHDIEVNTASTSLTTASTASAPITTSGVSVSTAEPRVSRETSTRLARGVIVKEASETTIRPTIPPLQIDPKDKAQRLQAELDEKAMLEREREKEAKLQTLLNGIMFKL